MRVKPWLATRFTKVCVYVKSESELLALHAEAKKQSLVSSLIQDSGFTQFAGVPTYTAVAVGPDILAKVDGITGHLPLL